MPSNTANRSWIKKKWTSRALRSNPLLLSSLHVIKKSSLAHIIVPDKFEFMNTSPPLLPPIHDIFSIIALYQLEMSFTKHFSLIRAHQLQRDDAQIRISRGESGGRINIHFRAHHSFPLASPAFLSFLLCMKTYTWAWGAVKCAQQPKLFISSNRLFPRRCPPSASTSLQFTQKVNVYLL